MIQVPTSYHGVKVSRYFLRTSEDEAPRGAGIVLADKAEASLSAGILFTNRLCAVRLTLNLNWRSKG